MTGNRNYLMEDQVHGLVRELMLAEYRRERQRSALARLLELGGLALTGSLSTFLLVWQL